MSLFEHIKKNIHSKQPQFRDVMTNDYQHHKLGRDLEKNMKLIRDMLGDSPDLKDRYLYLDPEGTVKIAFIYMNGMIDQNYLNNIVLRSMVNGYQTYVNYYKNHKITPETFKEYILRETEIETASTLGSLFNGLLGGDTVLLIDGFETFYVVGTRMIKERGITEPTTHVSVVGPKDSFTESSLTNLNLIRKRIKNPNLWVKQYVIGKKTNTGIAMVYLKGVADEGLVQEVMKRIESVDMESVLDSSYLLNALRDKKFCLFPEIYSAERPDVVAGNLLEGRVAVIIDGTPFVIIMPVQFVQFFSAVTDYYHKAYIATFFRTMRMLAFYVSILLPAFYIALTSLHSELVPFQLLVRIAAQRSGLPFPTFMEALLLAVIYDVLREASVRMPSATGSAITIVGALILGDSAVQAGIVSPIMVIIISGTAITTLVIPHYNFQLTTTVIKYVFILLSTVFGLYGITLGLIMLYMHLCSIRSFGVSYFTPVAPFNLKGMLDFLIRAPYNKLFKRSGNINDKYPH